MKEQLEGLPFEPDEPAWALITRAFAPDPALHTLLVLYNVMQDFARHESAVPTNEVLAQATGLSESTVKRGIRVLLRLGLIKVRNRGAQRQVAVPSQLDPQTFEIVKAVAIGEVEIEPRKTSVVHRVCKQAVDPERSPGRPFEGAKGLQGDPSSKQTDGEKSELSLFDTKVSSGSFGVTPETEGNSYGVCSCFVFRVTTVQSTINSGINSTINSGIKGRKALEITPEMTEAFEYWRAKCKYPRTKLEGKVASAFRSRLSEGFSVAELKQVADFGATDPWLAGKHPQSTRRYNGWETLYYSKDKVVKYLSAAQDRATSPAVLRDTRAVELSATKKLTSVDVF